MSKSLSITSNVFGKRNRNKIVNSSEDESNANKKLKPDCCRVKDVTVNNMNKSRIYNFGYRKKPAELFRKDLISAMKLADTEQLNREDYLPINDSWREEWEKGVQVAVNPDNLPVPKVRILREAKTSDTHFKLPKKLIKHESECEPLPSHYELDLLDLCWLDSVSECDNTPQIIDNQMEDVINELEHQCARNMKARQVGIEYDDHIICDVCRSPDAEESNEMVFCDLCNICVHQACYGITNIPEGEWLCRPCKEFGSQKNVSCALCPNLGGALKPTSIPNQWAHVSCALWVPEVSIGCVSTMEPITKIKQIPQNRWNLVCSLCNVKQGAPIQCSVKSCKIAYHVICAFNHKLKMKAIVESDGSKGVKLKSYCKKHTEKGDMDDDGKPEPKLEQDIQTSRVQHEIEIATFIPEESNNDNENDFWKYIDINKVQQELSQSQRSYGSNSQQTKSATYIDFVLQYWKLKRAANYGASLIKLTSSAQFEEQQLQHRTDILRLRVDLERIRNLSYMICRREKVKRNWLRTHQSTVEKALSIFSGINNAESVTKSVNVTEENVKLVNDIVNSSVIYRYDEKEDKTRTNCIIKTLKKLAKIDNIQKHKPNPYAKFYISHHKRKDNNETLESVNGLSTPVKSPITSTSASNTASKSKLNGNLTRNKSDKQLNGLPSPTHQLKHNSMALPVNGIHTNNSKSAHNISLEEKTSLVNYRQSSRSLLKPKISTSNVINSSYEDKSPTSSSPVPILTRSSLSGYKIPKKTKQEQTNKFESELDESIQNFKRRLDADLCTDIGIDTKNSPKTSTVSNSSSQIYQKNNFNFYNMHQQRGQYMTREKDMFISRSNRQNSLLKTVGTRAQHDEAALVASAANDIDMRRHISTGFRPSIIH